MILRAYRHHAEQTPIVGYSTIDPCAHACPTTLVHRQIVAPNAPPIPNVRVIVRVAICVALIHVPVCAA